jgi:hypothetical protein
LPTIRDVSRAGNLLERGERYDLHFFRHAKWQGQRGGATNANLGSAPASGAVFRALAENIEHTQKNEYRGILLRQMAGREAHPATPEAGVLPNSSYQIEPSVIWEGSVFENQ